MKMIKRIISYEVEPNIDIYMLSDGEFLLHAVKKANYRNTFDDKEHEHPMKITETPWKLYDLSDTTDWVFKRTNDNVEEILVLTEIHRMRISELSKR